MTTVFTYPFHGDVYPLYLRYTVDTVLKDVDRTM
jgi:hypothetical protein